MGKYVLVSLDDEKAGNIADVLTNKTSRKILDFLAEEKEASEKDISDALKMPMNTVEYNIKKLLKASLIEKSKNYFWSRKGRKIDMYSLATKHIIISPKASKPNLSKVKSLIPAFIITGIISLVIRAYSLASFKASTRVPMDTGLEPVASLAEDFVVGAGEVVITSTPAPVWLWFLVGSFLAIILFAILNWKKL